MVEFTRQGGNEAPVREDGSGMLVLTFLTKFRPKDLDLGDFLTPSMTKADHVFFVTYTYISLLL